MWHRYATFKDPGSMPDSPIRRRRIEFNPGLAAIGFAVAEAQQRYVTLSCPTV